VNQIEIGDNLANVLGGLVVVAIVLGLALIEAWEHRGRGADDPDDG
jgi:hypothetical protein